MRLSTIPILLLFSIAMAEARAMPEIEALLQFVKELDGTTFVRNGDEHTAKEAESHLRIKWSHQKSKIATVEDFVRLCATKSSISGKAYLIRFKDGSEEEAAKVLLKQLRMIRLAPAKDQ
ncbi:MAG: DUF5329 family protein [Verrucomicrobiota bacterium]